MARPGLTKHRKFLRLARLLNSQIVAMGALELMWQRAYEHGPDLGDPLDVEFGVGWTGEPGQLAAALVDAGFLDTREDGTVAVHDLFDHAPDYVLRRTGYETERRKVKHCAHCGVEFRSRENRARYCTPACRSAAFRETHANARDTHGNAPPAPALAPTPKIKIKDTGSAGADRRAPEDDGFDAFWAAYPRHENRAKALKAWKALKPSPAMQEIILRAIADQRTWRQWREGFVPHPTTWLHGRRWDDERPADDRGPANRAPVAVSDAWCEHDPPCRTQSEHIQRALDADRALRVAVPA